MSRLLIVEDNQVLSKGLKEWLQSHNYIVDCVESGEDGKIMLKQYVYDLIVLDWELPKLSGVELCKEYRLGGGKIPVLMLTGKNLVTEKISGLDAGADDYLSKPFELDELMARIRALLRRKTEETNSEKSYLDVKVLARSHIITFAGNTVSLSPQEFKLIEFFVDRPGLYFTLSSIQNSCFDQESSLDSIRVSIGNLRKKLQQNSSKATIKTHRGLGYRLQRFEND
ncbi:MAG: response regulator transcription factor [Candidatus Obscuribacterales bacterium]|nr:response regulator transcription factor [Candidatus Obscuribacterales bacterium]